MAKFKTKYGYFSDDGKEYIITRPDTPRPWVNVLSNGDYGLIISQTGSGFSWWGNSNLCRISRWDQDLIRDNWGKYIYIRDDEDGKFWSLGYKPVCAPFEDYKVIHGIGYTLITSRYYSIVSSMLIFVVKDEPLEIWKVRLRNESSKIKKLSLFSYFEWCLGNGLDTHREFQKTFIQTEYDQDLFAIFGRKRPHLVPKYISSGLTEWPFKAFHSVNIKPNSFEGDKEKFIGMYRDNHNPVSVEKGKLSNTVGRWYDSIASLHISLEIPPGEEKTIIFTLGSAEDKKRTNLLIKKYQDISHVDEAFKKVKDFWENYISAIEVQTPDEALNIFTNIWLKYQAISGRIWARAAYYQQSGAYGFRDQLQDSHIFLALDPNLTKKQILLHAEHQFVDGTVYHWWHPLTEMGVRTNKTDDLLWLVYLTLSYIYETGDLRILSQKVKYLDGSKEELYEHCIKAIERVLSRFSKHGLPLIGEGDWNDGLSAVGPNWKGESIWLGHFLYGILIKFSQICKRKGEGSRAKKYLLRAEKLKRAINKYAWDGKWFIRATRDDGKLLGSKKCAEGKIFLNAQTWSIIHNTATPERAKEALESAEKLLLREYGPLLFYPAYSTPDINIGYLTRYSPGLRENGGVYSHAATWMIMAECIMDKGDRAYDIYSRMCPINRGMNPDLYYAEPYVMPGNVDGPQSAHFGRGGWTWYTGSAAWMFKVTTEWLLGVRPTYEGLLIDPCIPKNWNGFRMKRKFRGAVYQIEVDNPNHVSKGIKRIVVDGRSVSSNIVSPLDRDKEHKVEVLIG